MPRRDNSEPSRQQFKPWPLRREPFARVQKQEWAPLAAFRQLQGRVRDRYRPGHPTSLGSEPEYHRRHLTRFPSGFVLSLKKTLFLGWARTLYLANAECGRQFVDAHDSKVAPALLQVADVFPAETGALCQLLSCETSVVPDSLDVSPDQLALIHAPSVSISIGCADAWIDPEYLLVTITSTFSLISSAANIADGYNGHLQSYSRSPDCDPRRIQSRLAPAGKTVSRPRRATQGGAIPEPGPALPRARVCPGNRGNESLPASCMGPAPHCRYRGLI